MEANGGSSAKTHPGSPRHKGLGGQLRALTAKGLRHLADHLDPPKPTAPDWVVETNGTPISTGGNDYRLTFLR